MADYYPLIARALETLPDKGPAIRKVVYDRARTALTTQLRSVQPALGEAEIERERRALDEAIARAEAGFAAEEAAPIPAAFEQPVPEVPVPSARPRIDGPAIRRGGSRGRSKLAAGLFVGAMVPVAILAWLWRDRPVAPVQAPPVKQAEEPAPPSESKFADRIGGGEAARPRPAAQPVVPASPAPSAVPPTVPRDAGAPVVPAAPSAASPSAAPPETSANAPSQAGAPPPAATEVAVAVAQRGYLIEENTSDPQQPKVTPGRTLWRLDALNGGQGQPLETVIRGSVEIQEAGLSLAILVRRNTDAAFPASHTIELTFTQSPGTDPNRAVRDVALPLLKPEEGVRGTPLAGLAVPVKENVFLIGLSDLKGDIERNTDFLLHRSWVDLPIRFASGQRAVLSFEKGVSGERVVADAFRQWGIGQ